MVLEFKSSKENLLEKKLEVFNMLKVKNFSGTLTDKEEKEFNDVAKWLKLHI